MLPVTAGLRHGRLRGRLTVERRNGGSRAVLEAHDDEWTVNRRNVGILLCGALGGLVLILLPWFPRLLQLVPIAVVLSLAAWFLVVARLRNSGPEDFLEALASDLESEKASGSKS